MRECAAFAVHRRDKYSRKGNYRVASRLTAVNKGKKSQSTKKRSLRIKTAVPISDASRSSSLSVALSKH